jgi:L-iditol 2-dehydrogenase
MEVLRLHAAGDLRLHEEPDPIPGQNETLVRVTAVGLCGSDLHWYEDGAIGDAVLQRPLVLGHEIGGVIAEGPLAGARVAVDPADPCERCELCLAGHANLCQDVRFTGHGSTDGALRTLMAWPTRGLIPVPDTIADDEVPLLETVGIAVHAADLGKVRAGMRASVHGCGPIGLSIIAVLRARGVRVVAATEPLAHRREAALAAGAEAVMDVDAHGRSKEAARTPVDVAFEAAGTDGAIATAVDAVKPGGRVVLVGIPAGDRMTISAAPARRKGLRLILSRRMKAHHFHRAITLAEAGAVDLGAMVTARYPLREGPAAFAELAERRGLKVVIAPSA